MEKYNNNENKSVSQALAGADEQKKITYNVGDEEIILTRAIVRNYLTRGNVAGVTDAEIVQFMSLCKANGLNPFVGDAYFVKYGDKPAQMVTSKEAFMKRAEAGPHYKGFQAGVIVLRKNEVLELEGSFFLPTDTLVGGWCKVIREGRTPVVAKVRLAEYNTTKSTWAAMPGTMIRKVAIAQAFREAYPVNVGGMYVPEEQQGSVPDDQDQEQQVQPLLPANSQAATFEGPAEAPAAEVEETPAPVLEARPAAPEGGEEPEFDANLFNADFKG